MKYELNLNFDVEILFNVWVLTRLIRHLKSLQLHKYSLSEKKINCLVEFAVGLSAIAQALISSQD